MRAINASTPEILHARRSLPLAAALLLVLVFAGVATAQTEFTRLRVDVLPPREDRPGGGWESRRDDAEAKASGRTGVVGTGPIQVFPSDKPGYAENGDKLRRAGVMPWAESEVPVIGVEFDYHHPMQSALKPIVPLLPENPERLSGWRPEDAAVLEFGRQVVPYLRASGGLETLIEQLLGDAMTRAVLMRVLEGAPEKLPTVTDADSPNRLKPYDGLALVRAALFLGERGRAMLPEIAKLAGDDQRTADWAAFLAREYAVLARAISESAKNFKPNFPTGGDNRRRWPDADRALVETYGVASLHFLEQLRSADGTFARKADWIAGWVKIAAATDLLNRLQDQARVGKLDPMHFELKSTKVLPPESPLRGAWAGLENVDDLWILIVCGSQVHDEVRKRLDEASALDAGVDAEGKERAGWIRKTAETVQKALAAHHDPAAARRVTDSVLRLRALERAEIERAAAAKADGRGTYPVLDLAQFGETERLRSYASSMIAKLNYLAEQVRARDQIPATNLFLQGAQRRAETAEPKLEFTREEYTAMGLSGVIEITPAIAARMGLDEAELEGLVAANVLELRLGGTAPEATGRYLFIGDPRYARLFRLHDRDLAELAAGRPLKIADGIEFRGDELADGRDYDFQNDIDKRGLSIEINPLPGGPRIPFALEPTRTYRLTFEYFAENLNGANTWLSILPLDAEGRELVEPIAPDPDKSVEEGQFVPYRFARHNSDSGLDTPRYTGTSGGWQQITLVLNRIPDPVRGFRFAIRVDRLTGRGRFAYRGFTLELKRDYYKEDFEPARERPEYAADGSMRPAMADFWTPLFDPSTRHMPAYSKLAYTMVNQRPGSTRALELMPNGFNMRFVSNELFELRPDRSYHFSADTLTERMGTAHVHFELLFYGERNGQPVPLSVDGVETVEGRNVLSTPRRGEMTRQIGLGGVAVGGVWKTDELYLDELRSNELEKLRGGGDWARIDPRERHTIKFVRIAIVVDSPKPEHSARVVVDNIQIREYPRVSLALGQRKLDPESSLIPAERDWGAPEKIGTVLAQPTPPQSADRFRLFIEAAVEGLAPQRAGYHYTLTLRDFLGNPVRALDVLGAEKLDSVVFSSPQGTIGSEEFDRIFLDELDLRNTFGYLAAEFELRFANSEQPLFRRNFLIGFVPPSLLGGKPGQRGDFGVVLDSSTEKRGREAFALNLLGVGRIMYPLTAADMPLDTTGYAASDLVRDHSTLMSMLPGVRSTAMLAPLPESLSELYDGAGPASVFADTTRPEWKKVVAALHSQWREKFDEYAISSPEDTSFAGYTAEPATALDNLSAEFKSAMKDWAPRLLPVALGTAPTPDALARAFNRRWSGALDVQPQATRDAVAAALTADEARKLREARPNLILLSSREALCFHVPAGMSVAEMESAITAHLGRIARMENVLGDTSAALANARSVLTGGTYGHAALAGELATAKPHSVVLDLLPVDPSLDTTYAMQLRDLADKLVRAKLLGFSHIYLSRLHDTADIPNGLLTRDNRAHPAFHAYRTLNAVLSGREVLPAQLRLASGARHTFFRDPVTREVSFIIFPGKTAATEYLPFGHGVSRVDLMGNLVALASAAGSEGTVTANLQPDGLPLIFTGIDPLLLATVESVSLDDPTIGGYEADQARKISVTNHFPTTVTLSLRIPLRGASVDADDIARDTRFKTAAGSELAEQTADYRFESVELAPGATRTFDFQLRPRQTMRVGSRVLPVVMQIKGDREYTVTRRLAVTVAPLISIDKIEVVDPGDGRGMDLVMRIRESSGRNGAFSATVSMPGLAEARPVSRDFSIGGNTTIDINRRLQPFPRARLEGQIVRVSVRQGGGALFFNEDYVARTNRVTNSLELVPERDARAQ